MKKIFSLVLIAIVLAFSVMPAMAAESPQATEAFNVIVNNNKGGSGSYTTQTSSDGKHVTLTAHNKDGYVFKYWVIDGKYVISDGDLTSPQLELLLKGDIEATPYFEKIGSSSTSTSSALVSQNRGSVSPETGNDSIFYIIGILSVFIVVAGALGVKLVLSRSK
jgi:uncharacterized protein YxeA